MGFFSLKAVCGVCSKEVGLNRFKVPLSDAWICPECLKKAGGPMQVNIAKATIEELKERVDAAERREIRRADKLVNDQMQVAEGMYDYCAKNGYGSGWNEKWGVKHFRVVENALMSGEEVLMAFIGLHNYVSAAKHDHYFAYAITNKRIIMAQKNAISGQRLQTVYLDNINDITFSSGVLLGIMTIDTIKEKFNVGLDKKSAEKINAKVHEIIDNLRSSKEQEAQSINQNISVADELKKFKELLDMGAISEEEFNKKKKQLLES